jgi:hypothetical protein
VLPIVLSPATRRAISKRIPLAGMVNGQNVACRSHRSAAVFETPLIFSFGAPDFSLSIAQ